ncbi:MAG: hypothetical protein ACRDQD_31810 [Nocardioidaceae bacterium]
MADPYEGVARVMRSFGDLVSTGDAANVDPQQYCDAVASPTRRILLAR